MCCRSHSGKWPLPCARLLHLQDHMNHPKHFPGHSQPCHIISNFFMKCRALRCITHHSKLDYPPFRKHCAREKKLLRIFFPRDCAKSSQLIARNNSWGIVFGGIVQFCCCSLLSYCACSMLPKIDLRNGHFVIAPKYF